VLSNEKFNIEFESYNIINVIIFKPIKNRRIKRRFALFQKAIICMMDEIVS